MSLVSKWTFSKSFSHENAVVCDAFLVSSILAKCPAHHSLQDFIVLTIQEFCLLNGSLVTTAWHILGLRLQEMARYGG
jgi:hypothetical protein